MKPVYKLILPLLLLPILAACSSDPALVEPDAPAAPSIPDGPIELGLVISLGDDNSAAPRLPSRAPAGDYHPGSGAENFIDIAARDFALYIFTAGTSADSPGRPAGSDARLVSRAEITELTPLDGDYNSSKTYTCRFRLDNPAAIFGADGRASFRLVMLANWRAWTLPSGTWADYPILPEGASIDDLYAAAQSTRAYTPDSPVGPTITRDTRIPLFGVQTYTSVDLLANGLTDLTETLHLLRAFAKIEVAAAHPVDNYGSKKITSVAVTRCHATFSALPSRVYDRAHYVRNSHALDYVDHVSIPLASPVAENLPLQHTPTPQFTAKPQTDTDGNGSWIIYLPEYDNTSEGAVASQLSVTFEDGATFLLDFKNYGQLTELPKDEPFDLRRNNWYIYTVNRRNHEITVEVDVQPYAECKMEVGVGLLTDEMGDLMIYMEEDPDHPGTLRLPTSFQDYITINNKQQMFNDLPPIYDEMGDYYAIHRGADGKMETAEIWLKDRDGAKVLSDFEHNDATSQTCSTREVVRYEGLSTFTYYKDKDGDRRQQHNDDHSSIIYDIENGLLYKTHPGKKKFLVESWDEKTGIFYVHFGDTETHYVFREFKKTGAQTGVVKKIDKKTGEEETLTGQPPLDFENQKSI